MKRFFFIIIITSFCWAKTWAEECAYNPAHENVLSIRGGFAWQQDQYLSPLLYAGQQVAFSNEWWQGFRRGKQQVRYSNVSRYTHNIKNDFHRCVWKHVGKFHVNFG